MIVFLLVLILLAVLGVLGAVIEGLLWLTAAVVVVLVAAAVVGYFKFRGARSGAT